MDNAHKAAAATQPPPSAAAPPRPSVPAVPQEGLWVDKYKPRNKRDIIGNPGHVNRLYEWLRTWDQVHLKGNTHALPPARNQGWGKSAGPFKAVMLSGPPGVGKSTTACLVAESLGFTVIEFNASDARTKKILQNQVVEMTSNTSITQFFGKAGGSGSASSAPSRPSALAAKSVLVMDEADGMSSGDRGGIAEMTQMIKKTKVPIIAICNDASSPKVRTLITHCEHMPFRRTPVEQISKRIMAIARTEGLEIDQQALWKLCESSRQDIRQVLTVLQLWRRNARKLSFDDVSSRVKAAEKNIDMGPFDITPKFFARGSHALPLSDRVDLYFNDYHLIPLMVQENYLNYAKSPGSRDGREQMASVDSMAAAAASISDADLVEESIFHGQNWQLSPLHAILSCIRPASQMGGFSTVRLNFPGWLGKNSNAKKRQRLLYEVHLHSHLATSAGPKDFATDCLPAMRDMLVTPLATRGAEGVESVLASMAEYGLSREDMDTLIELSAFPQQAVPGRGPAQKRPWEVIPPAVKANLTRRWNKGPHKMHVAPKAVLKGRKRAKPEKDDDDTGAALAGIDSKDRGASDSDSEGSDDELAVIEAARGKKGRKAPAKKKAAKGKGKRAKSLSKKPAAQGKGKGKRQRDDDWM